MNKITGMSNFKKMYLISSQKWLELSSKKKQTVSLSEGKENVITPEKDDNIINHSCSGVGSTPVVKDPSNDHQNGFDSTTNIRVDQNEQSKVKNINIGIKNDCNQSSDVKEVKKLEKPNNVAINQRNDTFNHGFVSCNCPKNDESYDLSAYEKPNNHENAWKPTVLQEKKRKNMQVNDNYNSSTSMKRKKSMKNVADVSNMKRSRSLLSLDDDVCQQHQKRKKITHFKCYQNRWITL